MSFCLEFVDRWKKGGDTTVICGPYLCTFDGTVRSSRPNPTAPQRRYDKKNHRLCEMSSRFYTDNMYSYAPTWLVLSSVATADIRQSALIPAVIITTLALGAVILRWYSRMCLSPSVCRVEDYCISGALLLSMCTMAVVAAGEHQRMSSSSEMGSDTCYRIRNGPWQRKRR